LIRYLLDTDICIYVIREQPDTVIRHLRQVEATEVGISAITLSELAYGVEKSRHKERNRQKLAEFLAPLQIAAYDERAGGYYGTLRAQLEEVGRPIGPLDALIAAHALSLGCTLVTNNEREFSRVSGLSIENWARPDGTAHTPQGP